MRIEDAARQLSVSVLAVHEWADSGYLERTGAFGDYFISDESVRRFAKTIARYERRKMERTRHKRLERELPDYFIRLDKVSEILDIPIHQTRLLAKAGAFDARKVENRWVMDGGQCYLFRMEHDDDSKRYDTATKILAQLKENRSD